MVFLIFVWLSRPIRGSGLSVGRVCRQTSWGCSWVGLLQQSASKAIGPLKGRLWLYLWMRRAGSWTMDSPVASISKGSMGQCRYTVWWGWIHVLRLYSIVKSEALVVSDLPRILGIQTVSTSMIKSGPGATAAIIVSPWLVGLLLVSWTAWFLLGLQKGGLVARPQMKWTGAKSIGRQVASRSAAGTMTNSLGPAFL